MRVLKTDLPSSFRINGVGNFCSADQATSENDEFATLSGAGLEDIKPPKAVEWYPDSGAWQFSYSRLQLRSVPQLKSLHGISQPPRVWFDHEARSRVDDTDAVFEG